mmetsp:Transcript_64408/g.122071  ORF Transcript_64408/g.122071 Transcript_64408/m.122071 type:complete len:81 (+) Transcript_64408:319-561(+)
MQQVSKVTNQGLSCTSLNHAKTSSAKEPDVIHGDVQFAPSFTQSFVTGQQKGWSEESHTVESSAQDMYVGSAHLLTLGIQ